MKRWLIAITSTPERRLCCALLALSAIVYIPFAGNYGMWDPWETHYGEVARQMLERNDFVSQWWPGSPQDRNEFWSKPVLTFWLMAMGMTAARLEPGLPMTDPHFHDYDAEMANSWRVEWAVRIPFIVDHYRAGVQSSRVNYDAVEFNAQVPDSLFAKPADIKAIKF